MKVTFDIPDNSEDIVLMYGYKDAEGNWIRGGKTFIPKRCGQCGELDPGTVYLDGQVQYKCDLLGCLVKPTDICRRVTS